MPGAEKATARTVAVIVLILLAGVALRGHLPGAEPAADEPAEPGAGPLIAVVVMLALSVAVIAVSIISQSRRTVTPPDPSGDLGRGRDGDGSRWTWRMVLVVAAALMLWLLVVLALMRVSGWLEVAVDQPDAATPAQDPPRAGTDPGPPPPEPEPAPSTSALDYLAAAAAVLVVLSVVGAMVGRHRRRRPLPAVTAAADAAAPPVSRTESLARAAERGLIAIGDLNREPREAIIACYAAMERELGRSPGAMPLDSDTPSEVLARAVDVKLLHGDSAAELVDLFEEARFSVHVMGEEHREAAVRVLQLVLRELQDAT